MTPTREEFADQMARCVAGGVGADAVEYSIPDVKKLVLPKGFNAVTIGDTIYIWPHPPGVES